MAKTRIFISSTFYDLKQVRADLGSFIRSLGYDVVRNEEGNIQCAGYLNASILERELTYPEGELENKREVDI